MMTTSIVSEKSYVKCKNKYFGLKRANALKSIFYSNRINQIRLYT